MWRYLTNCVRDGFHRGFNRVDVRCGGGPSPPSAPPPPPPPVSQRPLASPPPPHADADNGGWFHRHLCDSWINAFTWSGAFFVGWYASQLACVRHRRLGWGSDVEKCKYRHPFVDNARSIRSALVSRVVFTQPESPKRAKPFLLNNDSRTDAPYDVSNETTSGPSSEADEHFEDALRSIENKLGIVAIKDGNLREGVAMLQSSAQRDYAPALFNLALCYEKGLGVDKDEKMATRLYLAAANKNHSGAMYNLAIFYGQGRGGLKRDPIMAESLLNIAASKGQPEATTALEIKKKNIPKSETTLDDTSGTASFLRLIGCEEKLVQTQPVLLY